MSAPIDQSYAAGNGAREALERYGNDFREVGLSHVDHLLAWLWFEGFKVVPLDPIES